MDLPFKLKVHGNYIHIIQPPGFAITIESMEETWITAGRICKENSCNKVLIEAFKPERYLDTMSAFDAGRILAENMFGSTVAICYHDYEYDDLSIFFKTVAQNRGVPVEFFSDVKEAFLWLGVETGVTAE